MPLDLFNDALDDAPDKVVADGFLGFDGVTEPTKLTAATVRAGQNVWFDVDLVLQTRPGLAFNSLLSRATLGGGSHQPRGAGYYDVPGREAVLVSGDGKLYEITGHGNNATSNVLTPTPSDTVDACFAQLVDRMFWTAGTANTLHWSMYSGGAWSHGTVSTFSDASAMPTWGIICAHKFRLVASDPATGKLYASAVGAANTAANWVITENIRIGSGEGDPLRALISGQAGFLIVINERSAWLVDTSDPAVANWTSSRITGLAGAIEGKTAVQTGQDVIFLSADGVVSLGALQDSTSINPATTLSAPIQSYIDRINASAISTAWATMWRDHYLLAVPLDAATVPDWFLAFNTTTRQWATPWSCTLPKTTVSGTDITFAGFVCGVVSNFAGRQETLICDNTGRSLRWDKTISKDYSAAATTHEILSWATLKAFTHEAPENYKQPFWLQLEFFGSTAALVQVNLVRDGRQAYPDIDLADCEIIETGMYTNGLQTFPIQFPLTFQPNNIFIHAFTLRDRPRYRNVSVQVVSPQGRLRLRAARLAGYIDEVALE